MQDGQTERSFKGNDIAVLELAIMALMKHDYSRGARMSIKDIYEGLRQKIDLRKFIPGQEH